MFVSYKCIMTPISATQSIYPLLLTYLVQSNASLATRVIESIIIPLQYNYRNRSLLNFRQGMVSLIIMKHIFQMS
jgi:hypothetical protein